MLFFLKQSRTQNSYLVEKVNDRVLQLVLYLSQSLTIQLYLSV